MYKVPGIPLFPSYCITEPVDGKDFLASMLTELLGSNYKDKINLLKIHAPTDKSCRPIEDLVINDGNTINVKVLRRQIREKLQEDGFKCADFTGIGDIALSDGTRSIVVNVTPYVEDTIRVTTFEIEGKPERNPCKLKPDMADTQV
jgi:hypothetical protein